MSYPSPRPRVYWIKGEDPERALDDPGLALMAAAGWTIGSSSMALVDGSQRLMLVLWPPARRASDWVHWVVAGAAAVTAVGTWALVWVLA